MLKVDRAKLRSLLQVKQLAAEEASAVLAATQGQGPGAGGGKGGGRKVGTADVRIQSLQDTGGGNLALLPVITLEQLQLAEAIQVTLKRGA